MQRGSAGQMQRDNHQGNGTGGYMNRQAGSSVMGFGSRELDPVTPTPRSANLNRLGLPMIPADLGRIKPRPKQLQHQQKYQQQQQHAQPAIPRRQTTFPSSLVQQRHLPRITEDEDAAEDERQSEHEHEHEQVSFFKFKPDDFDYQPLGPSHSTPRIKRAASAPVQQVMAANPIVRSKLEGNILMAWNESGERVPPKVDWKTALAIIYNSRIENNIYILVQGVKQCRNCRDHARTHWDFGKSKTKRPFVQCFRPENNVTDGKSPAQRCTQCLLQNKVCVFDDDDDDDDEKGMEEETDEESNAIDVERARARALLARIDELETKSNRIEELEDTVASLRKQLGEMDTRMKRMAIVIVQLQDQRRA